MKGGDHAARLFFNGVMNIYVLADFSRSSSTKSMEQLIIWNVLNLRSMAWSHTFTANSTNLVPWS
jgi:hypothetical protein